MTTQKKCLDYYGETLEVGVEVIPMLSQTLSGFISKIEYDEKFNTHYITIINKEGKVLHENIAANYYTTQERFDERENQEFIYDLTFYNDKFVRLTWFPLTSKTDINHEIPENACLVTLNAKHYAKNKYGIKAYFNTTIYNYILKENVRVYNEDESKNNNKGHGSHYIRNIKDNYHSIYGLKYMQIYGPYRIVQSKEELEKYVRDIIKHFNSSDLSQINKDILYNRNNKAKTFEKKLSKKLSHK